jgi:hypothetical protein
VRILRRATAGTAGGATRLRTLVAFFGLCLAFFGGSGLVALAAIESLGRGVVAGSVLIGAGLVAWSVAGMRPPQWDARLRDAGTVGLVLLTLALAAEAVTRSLAVAVAAWAVAGTGMGLSYNRFMSGAFDDLSADRVSSVATALAFAETSATARRARLSRRWPAQAPQPACSPPTRSATIFSA